MDFDISVDDKTDPDYEIAENVAENLVDVIRSDMVGNEAQFLALNAAYVSGLSVEPSEYLQMIVRGKSGEGKTELKQNVDSLYPDNWLLRTGSTSDQGLVDADKWDEAYVGAFAEFQQIQGKMEEMVKSSSGDDADENGVGFVHTRNVDDGDGGRTDEDIEKQAMPTVFLFADENNSEIPKELQTRQMVTRVESSEEINRAVARTKFDHREVSVEGRDETYNFNFEDGKQAVRNHLANIPRNEHPLWNEDPKMYAHPVIIPHDDDAEWPVHTSEHETYGWDAFEVLKDILGYKRTESKRGAQAIANHIRAHTRMNYHNRETMDLDGYTYYVADPQDVANVISYRDLLLAVTHNMDEKKFAVIEALTDPDNGVGAPGPNGGFQAPHKDINQYIDEYADITSLSKYRLVDAEDSVLSQMEDDYLIETHKGEGENGAHLYEFLGGSTFGTCNVDRYPELFEHCTDPIRDQPISETVRHFADTLSVQTAEDLMADDPMETVTSQSTTTDSDTDDDSGTLSDFSDNDDGSDVEWDETDQHVHERLQDTVHDYRITAEDDLPTLAHMFGISPTDVVTDDRGLRYIEAAEPRQESHQRGTILSTDHELWGDVSQGHVEERVKHSVAKLREHDVFTISSDPDKPEHKHLTVGDLQ